jgi:hypothetical protein
VRLETGRLLFPSATFYPGPNESRYSEQDVIIKAAAVVLYFIVALGLLLLVYPWATYAAFDFPKQVTLLSYLLAAGMVTTLTTGASLLAQGFPSGLARFAASLVFGCLALGIVCIGFGPYGLDVPGTRLNGIFFSEWRFVTCFFCIGLPLGVLAAIGNWLLPRR